MSPSVLLHLGARLVNYPFNTDSPVKTPMSNLLVAMLNMLEVPAEKHGDSTGILNL